MRPHEAESIAQSEREHLAAAGYRRYQDNLKKLGAVDFDDLLLLTEELFDQFPAGPQGRGRSGSIMCSIDEYQDTNHSQYQIVKGLAKDHRNLCVVGDDDQSIYGWRGAEVTHILRFQQDWTDAKVVRLENNYRSTAAILEYANTLIAFNRQRHDKTLIAANRRRRAARASCSARTKRKKRSASSATSARCSTPRKAAAARHCHPLPHQRAAAVVRDRAAAGQCAVCADRRDVVLRSQGSPRSAVVFEGDRQPARRAGAAADHQPAAARHRRHGPKAAARRGHARRASSSGTCWPTRWSIDGVDAKTADAVQRFVRLIEKFRDAADKARHRRSSSHR